MTQTPLTVEKAAKRLGVSVSTIYSLCRDGKIQHSRIGTGRGTIRISESDLDAYWNACRHMPPVNLADTSNLQHLTMK